MAIARIEMCWTEAPDQCQQRNVARAVASALAQALKVPHDDPTVLSVVRDAAVCVQPGSAEDRFTIVTITLFAGRTAKTKAALFTAVIAALDPCGVPSTDALIVLDEVPTTYWGIQGGQPAGTVDIGFDVEI